MISERAGKLLIAAAVGGIVVWTSFGACSGGDAGPTPAPPPGSVSDGTAGVDASAGEPSAEIAPDGANDAPADWADGSGGDGQASEADVVHDVKPPPPGWEPVPWLPLPCWNEVYQPAEAVESVVPALQWIACAETGTGCLEISRPFASGLDRAVYANARKLGGKFKAAVVFAEPWTELNVAVRETVLFDDSVPKAAWRETWAKGKSSACTYVDARVTNQTLALALFHGPQGGEPRAYLASGDLDGLAAQTKTVPPPLAFGQALMGKLAFFERIYASDKLFVGHGVPGLVAAALPSGPAEKLPGSGYAWDDPRVYDDLVFATRREQVTSPEIWVRFGNGQLKPLVQSPGRWAHAFETDGTWMAWLEGVGQGEGSTFDHKELWKAPFTTDPVVLNAKKQKVADIQVGYAGAAAMMGEGLYALQTAEGVLYVYDLVTSVRHELKEPASDGFNYLDYVGRDEVWITVGLKPSNATYTVKRFAGSMFVPPL
jgi:hypothetical protein